MEKSSGDWILPTLIVLLLIPLATASPPELPRAYVDTTLPASAATCTITLAAGGDLQGAIDQAQLGDTICLQAGATFTGNFFLRNKETGTGWITIRTSTPDSQFVPSSNRVSPSDAAKMPKVVTPNSDPVFWTDASAHHYRFIGLEVTSTAIYHYQLFCLEAPNQNSISMVPHHLIIDRCYIHGSPTLSTRRGVLLGSANTAVINSYISEIHDSGDADAQAIAGWNGPGPYKIYNNYLEASTENIMFGGALAQSPELNPADIEIRHNHLAKPWHWWSADPSYTVPYIGHAWLAKNLLEFKDGHRVIVDGNIMENNWAYAQSGAAILITPRPGQSGPSTATEDITISNNIIRHSAWGITVCGFCGEPEAGTVSKTYRISISNNLLEDLSWNKYGYTPGGGAGGTQMSLVAGSNDVTINHNTILSDNAHSWSFWLGSAPITDVGMNNNTVITNNIIGRDVAGDSYIGTQAIVNYMANPTITKNLFVQNPGWYIAGFPAGNYFPAAPNNAFEDVGFVNYAGGNGGDYHLTAASPYKNAGTDGKDIGADIDAITAATAGVIAGTTDGSITPPPPLAGDVNNDNAVDILDVILVAQHVTLPYDATYDLAAPQGTINIFDIIAIVKLFK